MSHGRYKEHDQVGHAALESLLEHWIVEVTDKPVMDREVPLLPVLAQILAVPPVLNG